MSSFSNICYFFVLSIFFIGSCRGDREPFSSGKKLMEQYCGSCHLPVEAELLNRDRWLNSVLPAMAPELGIEVYQKKQYYPNPQTSVVSLEEWTKIVEYFEENAPEKIDVNPSQTLQKESDLFSVQTPRWVDSLHNIATTTLVTFDPFGGRIYSHDETTKWLYRWDADLKPEVIRTLDQPEVSLSLMKDSTQSVHGFLTSIGTLKAINVSNGKLTDYNFENGSSNVIGRGLPRPVHAASGDFNNDGRRDWLVCSFGHDTGGLYIFEQQKNQEYTKKTIRAVPGALDAKVGDFNNDGWQDIIALFAHGNEGIWMMINDQEGGFTSKNILQFPPVYGSTSFQLKDVNQDGHPDIIYTAGDNADYSQILKPYHGIYIFINQGDFTFEEEYFYHLNGATKAVAADFDDDGDLDIAAHAFLRI
ncbi:FG-GAP repeat domain-containing protein [Fodinibius salsisoli]|uniref:VCBS repeat-containing protein n=1 Tax=Fodinibius salsisoli TaxID=2820877 RepID=A0ABT3PNV1_9BACT|nr:VCBS repeat-containing protein [Fodinibius salsisoli]MCW9707523.1 VCBS repeat-containing protein [Fodinibius salsisoli]